MKFLKKVNALVLGLVVLLAFGCGGDEPEPDQKAEEPQAQNYTRCRIETSTIQGQLSKFIYNAQGEVIQITDATGKVTAEITYDSSGLLIEKAGYSYFGSIPTNKTVYEYNADSLPQKQIDYNRISATDPLVESGYHTFTYDAQKNLISRAYYAASNPGVPYSRSDFFFDANGIATRSEHYVRNSFTNTLELTSAGETLRFDNKKFAGQGVLYFDQFRTSGHNPLESISKQYQNGNLVSTTTYTYTYTYNAAGYPTQRVMTTNAGNSSAINYEYSCQ